MGLVKTSPVQVLERGLCHKTYQVLWQGTRWKLRRRNWGVDGPGGAGGG
ncbi:MAG: hypothetical protein ACD_23C01068G0002, partial [uncultured bacterium]